MAKKKRNGDSFVGNMVSTGVGNLVGVGLMGATADMTNALPAGTAKSLAGTAVGLQGVALIGHNVKSVKKSMGEFW